MSAARELYLGAAGGPLAALRRFIDSSPVAAGGPRCEMCAGALDGRHWHVVDLQSRQLLCACQGCRLLFVSEGAGGGRYRAVSEQVRRLPAFQLTRQQWERLAIPVDLAFFFFNSELKRMVAFYPGPAGATESTLSLEAWNDLAATNSLHLEPEVEALLVRGHKNGGFECYQVPIDLCYRLTGIVKRYWKGFEGGEQARSRIEAFFAGLREQDSRVFAC